MTTNFIALEDISKARKRIQGYAYRTPTYSSFSEELCWLKLECFQPVRSFKIRGASNKILSLSQTDKAKGVITASSGNHGLAVAYVASKLGIKATIVLPENVIPEKFEMIKSLGARTVLFGRQQDERQKKAVSIQENEGQVFIQPFNDPDIIAGQGTCGLELLEDVPDVETVFVPIGGGGLISGVSCSIKLNKQSNHAKVIGVQPEGSPSMYDSWRKGEVVAIDQSRTIADGLSVRRPGDITYSYVKRFVDEIMLVSDEEILDATVRLLKREHILAEPSGGASFAGLLKQRKQNKKSRSVAIVSGGNISSEMLRKVAGL
jgi:threonine dehydratase